MCYVATATVSQRPVYIATSINHIATTTILQQPLRMFQFTLATLPNPTHVVFGPAFFVPMGQKLNLSSSIFFLSSPPSAKLTLRTSHKIKRWLLVAILTFTFNHIFTHTFFPQYSLSFHCSFANHAHNSPSSQPSPLYLLTIVCLLTILHHVIVPLTYILLSTRAPS